MFLFSVIHLFFIILSFKILIRCDENIQVKLPLGNIIGTTTLTRNGVKIFTFYGIRYAEPPIGNKRFLDPVPVQPWKGDMNATKIGLMCPQAGMKFLYSEDCLNLDIYTKNLSGKFPVLAYIHGGAFEFGNRFHAQPQYLLDKDVVLVSINYRLGPLGFFNTGTKEATGNYGLKDQVIALKWIRDNIKYFGGDSQAITLVGHSAGGMSVTLHLLSPMSQGLFHKVIIMSGTIIFPGKTNITELSKNFVKVLNCSNNEINIQMECLRQVSVEDIIKANQKVKRKFLGMTWNYELESNFGQEIFIEKDPIELFVKGNFSKIPMIIGITKDEFAHKAYELIENRELLNFLNENFDQIAPDAFQYDMKNEELLQNATKALHLFYFNNQNITSENIKELGKFYSDSLLLFGAHRFLNVIRKFIDVFFYQIDFIGRFGYFHDSNGKPSGIFHADDLQYIFLDSKLAPTFNKNDRENIMVERMIHWFTTFAQTGDPNSNPNKWTENCYWPITSSTKISTLYIDEICHIGDEPNQDRYKLWDELFPIPN